MASVAKNQTNPAVIDATGYMPYVLKRQERASSAKTKDTKSRERDEAIRNYWVKERMLQDIEGYVYHHEKDLFRSKWECAADKKCLYSRVKWEIDKINERKDLELRERKDRLKEMLSDENDKYESEIKANQPSLVSSKAEMLSRYKTIMTEKELERRKIADAKKEQQFRNNCDELRTLISKKICHLVTEEGKHLMEEKTKDLEERSREDKMFAEAWLQDAQAKQKKECEDASRRKERNMQFAASLKEQFQSNDRKDICGSATAEAQIMAEQKRLYELEKEWEEAEKKIKQERMKKGLDECLKAKLKRRAKEVQEDLMLDLYFLDKISSDEAEIQKILEKKNALKKEQDDYMAYLADQIKKEAEFEKHLEQMQQEESDKMWARREKEWEANRKMREALNKKAMKELHEQIKNKLQRCRLAQKMKMEYDKEIVKQAELDKQYIKEEERLVRESNIENQKHLRQQIKEKEAYIKELKSKEKEENKKLKKMQEEYEKKIQEVIANPEIPSLHPYRLRSRSKS